MSSRLSPISTDDAPAAIGPYVQGLSVEPGSRLIFASGQLPIEPESGELVTGDPAREARQALTNALAVLAEGGAKRDDVVKATLFVVDLASYPVVNEVYAEIFDSHLPARSVVGVAALPRGASVEVELIAAVDN